MKVYSADNIRNVVVLGHSGSGKTTLMEAALNVTGITTRMGKVDEGNTVSDYEAEEIRRRVSINASMIPIEWKDCKINFIDTPGFFDFINSKIFIIEEFFHKSFICFSNSFNYHRVH